MPVISCHPNVINLSSIERYGGILARRGVTLARRSVILARFGVIPVKTGIQSFYAIPDPGFRRGDGASDPR